MNLLEKIKSRFIIEAKRGQEKKRIEPTIVGCTLGFDCRPHLAFSDGTILWGDTDKIFHSEYWPENWRENKMAWPIDPATGEKLPIV